MDLDPCAKAFLRCPKLETVVFWLKPVDPVGLPDFLENFGNLWKIGKIGKMERTPSEIGREKIEFLGKKG